MQTGRLVKLSSTIQWHGNGNGTTPRSEPAILANSTLLTVASPRLLTLCDRLLSLECQSDRLSGDTVSDRQLAERGPSGSVSS